jgi:hypothetical protein
MPQPSKLGKISFSSFSIQENLLMSQLIDNVNALAGHNGPTQLSSDLNLGGNKITNVAPPTEDSDVLTSGAAKASYSAAALGPQLSPGGKYPFVGYRQINNGTQRENTSSFLNNLVSTAPNSNNINPIVSTSGGATSITIPASVLQMGDGSTRFLPARTDTISNPESLSISSFTVTSGVATVILTTDPATPFSTSTVVFIAGTGQIDGTFLVASVVNPATFTIKVSSGESGTGGTVSVGGANYYFLDRKFQKVMLLTLAGGTDTPFNRLGISGDGQQLLAVVNLNSGGAVQEGTAGGGTPSNVATANAGSRF